MKLVETIPILQISIAIDLAYLALDRFRHNKVIAGLLEDYLQSAEKFGARNKSAKSDTTLTEYGDRLYKIRNTKHGYSWDIWVIAILTAIQIITLYCAALNSEAQLSEWYRRYSIPTLTIVAMILPICMVWWGNFEVNSLKKKLDSQKDLWPRTYQSTMKQQEDKVNKVKFKQA